MIFVLKSIKHILFVPGGPRRGGQPYVNLNFICLIRARGCRADYFDPWVRWERGYGWEATSVCLFVCVFVCVCVCSWVGRPTLLLSVCSRVGRGPLPRPTRSLFVPGRAREGGLAATHPCPTRSTHPLALIAIWRVLGINILWDDYRMIIG